MDLTVAHQLTRTIKVIRLVTVFANRSCSQENTVKGDITVIAPLLSTKPV
jgi:hypothetical protein